jgi:hypothetical protein
LVARTFATIEVLWLGAVKASGHLVKQSIIITRYQFPWLL